MNRILPLTETLRGMFLEWNEEPESTRYTLAVVNRFPKTIDADRLVRAVEDAVAADPLFRTRIVENEDGVGWTIDDGIAIGVERITMSESEAAAYVRNFARGFDAFKGPLARFRLIETPESFYLASEVFHLISDGTSFRSFLGEIGARYRGEETAAGSDGEVFFSRYAEGEEGQFAGEEYAAAKADAARRFAGRAMTAVEVKSEGKATGNSEGETFLFEETEVERREVDAFCERLGINANLFFMGVFARTLSLYSREKDVVFSTVNHGRGRGAVPVGARGCYVKLVPVLGEMKGVASVSEYFGGFRLHRAGVYPFSHFCRDLGMKGGWTFVYQEGTVDCVLDLDGVKSEFTMPMSGGAGAIPGVEVYGGDRFRLKISCTPGGYDRAFLRRFVERMRTIAENFAASKAEDRLRDVPVLSPDETAGVLKVSRGGDLEYDRERTFIDVFREQARRRPEATAVVDAKTRLGYRELDERSDALAAVLLSAGVEPGGFVAVKLPRTVDFAVAVIAVQKCGCGYVPVDPEYPQDRIDYMVSDSGAKVIIDEKWLEEVKGSSASASRPPSNAALRQIPPSSPAYMIYTSGSTGRPKGVVVPHRALANLITWVPHDLGITERSRIATHPSFSFDASVIDIFPALAAGAELHILEESIRRDVPGMVEYVRQNGITGLTMSTQIGMAVINAYPDIPLEYIQLGGEKLLPVAKTKVRIVNGYGPTEFCVSSSYHVVDQAKDEDIPIGRAVPNTWSLVVDVLGQPVPEGMAGEIALVGPQISDGYWHQPEKTDKAFVDSSIRRFADFGKMYLTGDLARYNGEGNLEYLGRIDTQVKLRGFRIEIGEIESVAKQFPGVGAVAAEVRKVGGAEHLVLYFEDSGRGGGAVSTPDLKSFLASKLTGYMVPDYFVAMGKLPITPNGKIDRKKLPDPKAERVEAVRPEGEAEERVFAAVAEVLKREDFGVTHDFAELGMTSLTAMELVIKLYRVTGVKVSMRDLAACSTVRKLAARFSGGSAGQTETAARPQQTVTTSPLAENQRSIYADWLRNPGTTQYNIPVAIRFAGIDAKRLTAAMESVLDAHASFAIRLSEKEGGIVQTIGERCGVETVELEAEPDAAFFAAQVRPFTPLGECLARVRIFSTDAAAYLFLDVHHIVFDGCSMGIVFEDLRRALSGEKPVRETRTALDAVEAERRYAESGRMDEDERWFELYLGGAEPTVIEDSESGADGRPGEAGRVSRLVPSAAIETRAKALGATASDCFLTLFTELLRRSTANDEVLVNFVTAGRSDPDSAGVTGMFVKTLPIKGIRGAKSIDAAVRRMHLDVLDLIDRERVSYRRLVERCGIRPEVMFAYEGGIFEPPEGVELIGLRTDTVKAPFAVTVTPGPDGFKIEFEYDRSRYSETDMQGLLDRFAGLAESFASSDAPATAAGAVGAEPANETERTIVEIYRGLLNLDRFGATDDFFGLGGTSIVAINAVIQLQKAGLPVQYGDVFTYKTPRALAEFIAPHGPQSAQTARASQDFSEYDYAAIDRMLKHTRRELYEGFELHPLGTVLLAGATGYLGIHVLRYLLERTDSPLVLLVRSRKGAGPERRIDSQYVYYFGERVPERFRSRISYVEGDITEPDLADRIPSVSTVINCAALVKHYVADDRMAKINVGGVENLIAFCAKSGARLVQTSTYSIGGAVRAVVGKRLDERRLYLGQETDNEYIRTKFLAERAVLEATAAGRIRGKIMRLGNLMGRESDGEFQMNVHENAFVNSLRTYRALGAYPLEELTRPLEMSPIDRVAEAICLLATTPDDMYVFHPYNRYALDMGAVVEAMNDRGFGVERVSRAEFAARVEALKADSERASELQGILHYAVHLDDGMKMVAPDNDWTSTVLYRLGFRWRPAESGYLGNFLSKLGELAVFD